MIAYYCYDYLQKYFCEPLFTILYQHMGDKECMNNFIKRTTKYIIGFQVLFPHSTTSKYVHFYVVIYSVWKLLHIFKPFCI